MDDYDRRSDLFGQPSATHEGLAGIETPGALVERRVQGKYGDAVPVGQVGQVGVLVGIPALVEKAVGSLTFYCSESEVLFPL
jgi:hypothetical protein